MLFLLKRTWPGSLAALVVLTVLGFGLRALLNSTPILEVSTQAALLGLAVCAGIVASDGLVHGLSWLIGGESYCRRFHELAGLFRNQSSAAIFVGALMAGIGEEALFRGLSSHPLFLAGSAILFGLLHHIRRSLLFFTLWSIYEGLLLAGALYLTGNLFVPMVAHFLHDLGGFYAFRYLANRSRYPQA